MKPSNADIQKKIQASAPIFQGARRSDISTQIRSKMAEKGLKNVDIASRLGVSEANVSRWLRGNQNLSVDTIYQLADAVEEPLHIFVGSMVAIAQEDAPQESHRADYGVELVSKAPQDGSDFESQEGARACNVVDIAIYARMRTQVRMSENSHFAAARSESGTGAYEDELMVK